MKQLATIILLSMFGLAGCQDKGPAEKVGESIDNGVDTAKDAVQDTFDPGPAERAGEKIDDAVDDATDN